jgi:NADPH:quinone reductase-like Zn-dependent oxidoreductase
MQAVVVQGPQQEPTLAEVPVPEVAAGHVLVRVQAAGVNAIDKCHRRRHAAGDDGARRPGVARP